MSSSTSHRRPHAIGALAAVLAVPLAVVVATIARPAVAHAAPAGAQSAQSTASAQAEATGEPVTIDADTTAYSTTDANPDGSYTWTASLQPLHARKDGQWVTPDATLQHNNDGTISPIAAASTLILSGGGDGPLATFDDGQGHHLSAALPMHLPTPTLNANTATYPSVLPGVDLVVTADVRGGMSDVFVVHDATAATNPALTSIELGLTGDNLVVATDPNGAISANDPTTETTAFAAPPPLMWDSTTTPTAAMRQQSATATATADPADTPPTTSSVDGPGLDAHVTPVPVQPDSDAVTLTPPADALTGDGVTYPLYIDPQIDPATNPEAYVQSKHPSTTAYNPSDNLRTGYSDWDEGNGWLPGVTRTFLRYDGLGALAGKDIREAHLQLTEVSSSDHSTSNFYSVAVSDTGNWGSSLDWSNQPGYGAVEDDAAIPGVPSGQTSDYQITVTDMVQYGVGKGWTGMNMVMHAGDEQNDMKYKHWALHPKLVVTYWSTPDQPQGLKEINGGQATACAASPGPWIPAAANNTIDLHYTVSTADTNTALAANTWVSEDGAPVVEYSKAFTYSSGNYPIDQNLTVADGHSYGWYAQTNNPYVWSKISATCYFRYDSTPPTAPAVTSTAYPANGPTTVTANQSGTLTLSANDPLPAEPGNIGTSGIKQFNYNINGTSINSGGGGEKQATASTCTDYPCIGSRGTVTIPLSVLHWGTNTLWAQTVDNAGNVSQPVHYDFYIQQSAFGAYTPGTAGDIDGDNTPDLVTVDAAGNLRLFTNPEAVSVNPTGNTTDDPQQYGGRVLIPHDQDALWPSGTFSGALVAHAGSFTGHNADDLILVQHGNLGIEENINANATGWHIKNNISKPACPDCKNYDSADWSSVDQLIAVPDLTAGGRPSIITVEFYNGDIHVLLYPPLTAAEGFGQPTELSSDTAAARWEDLQLLSAAPLPGLPGDTLIMRNVGNNNLETVNDVTNLRGTPVLHVLAAGMFPTSTYQQVATLGRADADGNWPVWAANADGTLDLFRATTSNGTTTWANSGAPRPISNTAWSGHELSLAATYASYNNSAFVNDGYQTPASFDGNGRAYSAQAMSNATLGAGITSTCPLTDQTCTTTVTGGQQLTTGNGNGDAFILAPSTANNVDDWSAAGQTLPAPFVNFSPTNFGYAQHIAFLGAGTTSDGSPATGTATVTFTDGHTQQIPITLSDWTLNNNQKTPATGNTIAATGTYLDNTTTGTQTNTPTYLFTTTETQLLDNGQTLDTAQQQIASITLPNNRAMHIFAIAVN